LSHLRRGVQVHQRLSRLQSERDAALEVLDRLPLGVILLDGKGRPAAYNRSAEDILDRADALTLNSEGLAATTSSQTAALRKLIHDAVSAGTAGKEGAGGVMALPPATGLRPLALVIAPVCELDRVREQDELAAVLFVSDPEEQFETAHETLERLYGLTHAEARITVLLSQGKPLAEAAEILGIGTGTARAHLKHVFGKTGTRRQAELVRLVVTGPAHLRQD
jgi:DNA-binding CsgD family transcriptional regulator